MEVLDYVLTIFALICGVVVHILKKVIEIRQDDHTFHLRDYLAGSPYKTLVSVLMSVGGYLTLQATGELTLASAFLMGVTANSLSEVAPGKRR